MQGLLVRAAEKLYLGLVFSNLARLLASRCVCVCLFIIRVRAYRGPFQGSSGPLNTICFLLLRAPQGVRHLGSQSPLNNVRLGRQVLLNEADGIYKVGVAQGG